MTILKTLALKSEEVLLLKKIVPELEMWPGGAETPHGIHLNEDEENIIWNIINKIKEL